MTVNSLSNSSAVWQTTGLSSLSNSSRTGQVSGPGQDSSQVSELGKLMKQLSDLQQSDPSKFKEVTATISKKLEEAASTATENGDSRQAKALSELADKFKTASENGEVPDLKPSGFQGRPGGPQGAGGTGGPGGPPPGPPPSDNDSDDTTDSSTSSTSTTASSSTSSNTLLRNYLKLLEQNQSENPMSLLSNILQDVLGVGSGSSGQAQ